jgi:heme exporter protein B
VPWSDHHVLAQALLFAGKDLEIEWRSRATAVRVLPFAGILVLLFAIALDPDRGVLPRVAPGLFWLAVVLSALLAIGRAVAVERDNDAAAGLIASGLDPAAMFLGKAAAVAVELLALEALTATAMAALYDVGVAAGDAWLLLATSALATLGIAAAGTLYGAVASGDRSRDSLLAILLLPVLLPVVLAGTRLFEAATQGDATGGDVAWLGLLAVFAALYGGVGVLAFGPLLEEA